MRYTSKYLRVYPWHSINLIPSIGACALCSDDEVPVHDSTIFEVVVLGVVVSLSLPFTMRGFSTPLVGPLWSKRRRVWYRAPN